MRGVSFSARRAVFVEKYVLVSVHDFNLPVIAVEGQKVFGRGLFFAQAGDEEDGFVRRFPLPLLLALDGAVNTANLPNARPLFLDLCRAGGQNINAPLLDATVRLFLFTFKAFEGEKLAPQKPSLYSHAAFSGSF